MTLFIATVVGVSAGVLPEMVILLEAFKGSDHVLLHRCPLLNGVQKTIDSNEDWDIVARREHPEHGGWSVVVAHGGPLDSDEVVPTSLLIFESVPGTNGLTVSHCLNGRISRKSLRLQDIGGSNFVRRLRGDLEYEIEAFPVASSRGAIRVVRMVLADRVRELEQPDVLLTSGLLPAD